VLAGLDQRGERGWVHGVRPRCHDVAHGRSHRRVQHRDPQRSAAGFLAVFEVLDGTRDKVLGNYRLTYNDWTAMPTNKVKVPFVNEVAGNALQFRVRFLAKGTVDVFQVVVAGPNEVTARYQMSQLSHNIGSLNSDGTWSIGGFNLIPSNNLTFGPYVRLGLAHKYTALFKLQIEEFLGDSIDICRIEVRDFDSSTTLASRTLSRKDFTNASSMQSFPLEFYEDGSVPNQTGRLEFRVWWNTQTASLKQGTLAVQDWGVGRDPQF
jgi:hypothetical protein